MSSSQHSRIRTLELFVQPGEVVSLVLQGGITASGIISKIEEDHLILTHEGRNHCIFADGIISAEWAANELLSAANASHVPPEVQTTPADEPPFLPFEPGLRGGDDLDKSVAQIREKLESDSEDLLTATDIVVLISHRFIHSTIEVRTDQVMRKGLVTVFKLVERCRERGRARRDEDGARLCSNMLVEINRALRTGSQDMEVIERFIDAYHFLVAAAGDEGTWELQNWISETDWKELGAVLKAANQQWAPQIEKDAHITDTWKKRPFLQAGFYKRRSLICSALAHYNWEGLMDDQIDALRRESREWAAISVRTAMPPPLAAPADGKITSFGNAGYGFLRSRLGEDFQFRLADVVDPEIRKKLFEAQGQYDIPVDFDAAEKESYYARHRRAVTIRAPGFRIFQIQTVHVQSPTGYGFMQAVDNGRRNDEVVAYFNLLLLPPSLNRTPDSGDCFLARVEHTPSEKRAQYTCREMRELWSPGRQNDPVDTHLPPPAVSMSVARSKELLDLARASTLNENYDQAVRYYEECMTLKVWPDCVFRYAALLKNLDRDSAATEIYRRGMQTWPDNYKIHEDAGVHAMSQQDHASALNHLRRAAALAHAHPARVGEKGALLALGRALSDIGTPEALREALQVYRSYFESYGGENVFYAGKIPPRDVRAWEKVKELTHEISKQELLSDGAEKVVSFFRNAGFQHHASRLAEEGWTDLVFSTPADWEEVHLRQQIYVRCLEMDHQGGVDLNSVQSDVNSLYPGVDQSIAFLITPHVSPGLKEALAARLYPRRGIGDGFMLFLVDLTYDEVSASPDSRKMLHDRITNRMFHRDAFNISSVVTGWQFFGREALLAEVGNIILQDQAVGIFGLRRSGKTSFLAKFAEQQRAKGNLILTLDCQAKGDGTKICTELGRQLYEEIEKRLPLAVQWNYCSLNPGQNELDHIEGFLRDLETVVRLYRGVPLEERPRILIFLDEIDYFVTHHEADAFGLLGGLRGLHQIRPEALGLIVAAPNVNLQERTRVPDRRVFQGSMDNPVFHYLVAKYLPFLSEVETAHMLTDIGGSMGIMFDEQVCREIYKLTAGHPMILRCIASMVVTRLRTDNSRPSKVLPTHVASAAEDYLKGTGPAYQNGDPGSAKRHFDEILERIKCIHPGEYEALLILARNSDPTPKENVAVIQGSGHRHLIGYQLVKEENGFLSVSMELLKRHLQQLAFP